MRLSAEVLHANLELDLSYAGWKNLDFPGISHQQIAMNRLHSSLIKKFHNEEVSKIRDEAALQLFLECNEKCHNFDTISSARLDEEYVIGELKRSVYNFFNPRYVATSCTPGSKFTQHREPLLLNRLAITAGLDWGNGSNIGVRSTDFYSKSTNSRMSTTSQVLALFFRQDVSVRSQLWADVEAFRSSVWGYESVPGSRLSFVPKSKDISRTICTEPLLNMLYQLGIANVLEGRLREVFGINFASQPSINARLAHIGSVDGSFGTIDLSSASDTISYKLCKELIPAEPMRWLDLCRSPATVLPDGSLQELHMISSMGNGYTFPLQTMIFACLVSAVYRVAGIPFHKPTNTTDGNFAVFGDDIIVDRRVYDLTVRCLEILGFTVNRDKSFNEGPFRESCGSDWFSGHNVRGVYIKRLLTDGDVYSAINRLNRWSAYHDIKLVNTVSYLRRGCRFLGVPYDEADDAGIKIPLSLARHARGDIHGAYRYLALCNLPLRVELPVVGYSDSTDISRCINKVRKFLPDFEYNGDGLLLALLAGHLRGGSLGLRLNQRKAVLRRRVCPGWDRWPSGTPERESFGERWKTLTAANLVSSSAPTS